MQFHYCIFHDIESSSLKRKKCTTYHVWVSRSADVDPPLDGRRQQVSKIHENVLTLCNDFIILDQTSRNKYCFKFPNET